VGPEAATLRLLDRVEDGASAVRCSVSLGRLARASGEYAGSNPGPWYLSQSIALSQALSNARFDSRASAIGSTSIARKTSATGSSTRRTAVYGPVRTMV